MSIEPDTMTGLGAAVGAAVAAAVAKFRGGQKLDKALELLEAQRVDSHVLRAEVTAARAQIAGLERWLDQISGRQQNQGDRLARVEGRLGGDR